LRDGGQDQLGSLQWSQCHEPRSIAKIRVYGRRDSQRQARLTRARRAGEREQSHARIE
jgi:hypothetical protein